MINLLNLNYNKLQLALDDKYHLLISKLNVRDI